MAESLGFRRAVEALNMPPSRYAAVVVAPAALGSVAVAVLLLLALPQVFSGYFIAIPYSIPLIAIGFALMYPLSAADQRRHEIDHSMHYFITHLGVLATSSVQPVELFRIVGRKTNEYGPLAEECKKIATLVQKWNMSLAEACRFVAKRTPSLLFSDFLERFAFGIESGTEMEPYLEAEQEVVMTEYENLYQATLDHIDRINEQYNGMMMSVIFMAILALLAPVLVGGSATIILLLVSIGVIVIQGMFLMLIKSRVPPDPVWASGGASSPLWERLRFALPASVAACAALGPAAHLATNLPLPITIAVTFTPLLVPGVIAIREEKKVKRRDDNYPAFIRSLGASAAARGGDAREVLRRLRHHDFGPLTKNIRDLFSRLQMRVDDEASWGYFTTEAGSHLVERFTQMYDEAIDAGGRPNAVGNIISDNMVRILGLRKLRYQKAGGFRGTLYGIAAAMAFTLYVGKSVVGMLTGLFEKMLGAADESAVEIPTIIFTDAVNLGEVNLILLGLLVANAAISSIMVALVDGGARTRSLADFSGMVWLSNVVALIASKALESLL